MTFKPILDVSDLHPGKECVQVTIQDKVYITSLVVLEAPRKTGTTCVVRVKKTFKINGHYCKSMEAMLSLRDVNVIPNTYSNSTLWPGDEETTRFLQQLSDTGIEGCKQYLDIIKQYDLGIKPDTSRTKEEDIFFLM